MKTKIRIAVIAMMCISFGVEAQWDSAGNNSSKGSITILGGAVGEHFKRKFDYNGGGWARSFIEFENSLMTSSNFRIGSYGGTTDYSYTYFGYGVYSDIKNFRLYPNGSAYFGGNVEIASGQTDGSNAPVFRISSKDVNAINNQVLGEIQFYNGDLDGKHISSFIKSLAAETYGRKGQLTFGTSGINSTDAIERMRINENGNVGIGTTSPSAKLHIKSNDSSSEATLLRLDNSGTRGNASGIEFYSSTTDSEGANRVGRISGKFDGGSFTNARLSFHSMTSGNVLVETISLKNGEVGIGTTSPNGWKLAVNGKIRAKEIKVETGWSDFVFYDDYKLPTLIEVEKHIKEKGHLKDIPSAKEVEKNGIFLGEMNSKLLQKIEELTLYTIEQEKKIKVLEKQSQEIKELKILVKKLLDNKK
ncbi:hypothetical protein [uncultured Tenacibaculum sp.]|uniref:hypothetical protein n=1 Tax=uncultured Tenacibaculum sp. TaxID=174713 RepID=UPI00261FFC62|nr:hypothetical protein [uncultured Tenacibaculum sp.]